MLISTLYILLRDTYGLIRNTFLHRFHQWNVPWYCQNESEKRGNCDIAFSLWFLEKYYESISIILPSSPDQVDGMWTIGAHI